MWSWPKKVNISEIDRGEKEEPKDDESQQNHLAMIENKTCIQLLMKDEKEDERQQRTITIRRYEKESILFNRTSNGMS